MPPRAFATALLVLLFPTAVLAASGTSLTIYHANNNALFSASGATLNAGHALVDETRTLTLEAGSHPLRISGLPAALDPEAIFVNFGTGPAPAILGQRVVLANASAGGALEAAVGQQVSILTGTAAGGAITGKLVGVSGNGLLVRGADGKAHLVHRYVSVTLPDDAVAGGSTLILDVNAKASGARKAHLTYTAAGLGWRAAYTVRLSGGQDCRMRFEPQASIANRSGRDYANATVKLVAGQPNLGDRGVRMYRMAAATAVARAAPMPKQTPLGDYREFTLPGAVNLPSGSVTLTPLYASSELACQREYVVEDGGPGYPVHPMTKDYGARGYQDRPIASTLAFAAPEALPAGTLRAWTNDHSGAPALLGEAGIPDTPEGQRVSVHLGQSFNLRVSRERTAFHVNATAHKMREAFRITLTNGGATARTVTLREHPRRWREWSIESSNIKPSKQTPQLLEFKVPVPAHGKATLDYTVGYTWTARDM